MISIDRVDLIWNEPSEPRAEFVRVRVGVMGRVGVRVKVSVRVKFRFGVTVRVSAWIRFKVGVKVWVRVGFRFKTTVRSRIKERVGVRVRPSANISPGID